MSIPTTVTKEDLKFKTYVDKSPDGIIVMDLQGNHISVNPAICKLLDYSEDELLTMSVRDIAASKDLLHYKNLIEKGISRGEVQVSKKDGSLVSVDIHAIRLEDCYLAFFRDITEIKVTKQALEWETEFNSILAENSHLFLSTTDFDSIASVLLEKAVTLTESQYGYSGYIDPETGYLSCPNTVGNIDTNCSMVDKTAIFKEYRGLWGWVLKNKKPLITNSPAQDSRSTGVPFGHVPVNRFISVPALINDTLVGQISLINSTRDYSSKDLKILTRLADLYAIALQRKQAEEKILESEKQYDLLLNGISEGFVLLQVEDENSFRYLKANKSALKMLDKTKNEVIGKLLQEVNPKDEAELRIALYKKVVKDKKKYITKAPEPYRDIEIKIDPLIDREDKCTHLIIFCRDISGERKTEEHLLKVQKLESVGLLAGGIAHDFNNILTSIMGNVSLAKLKMERLDRTETAELYNLLTEAEKASNQARNLTQQLLTFAKGGTPILKSTTISDLLKNSAGFALRGSNVKCDFRFPEDLWKVEADEGQMGQVIYNLVINADQSMPYGGVIQITADNVVVTPENALPLKEGNYVKILISDTGVGIPKDYLDKIFDPYFSTKQKGSGLGLTTSYSIINKHRGLIEVESKLGIGSSFTIFLPASHNSKVQDNANYKSTPAGSGKVLIMDDEEILRYVVGEMLLHLGYEPTSAGDGSAAIELYVKAINEGEPFDAVIMDLTVPGGMGGKEAIERLLELDPDVRAIVSSGYSNDPIMAEHLKYGFKEVLAKPYTIENLAQVLHKVINKI